MPTLEPPTPNSTPDSKTEERKPHTYVTMAGRAQLCVCEESRDHYTEQIFILLQADEDDEEGLA